MNYADFIRLNPWFDLIFELFKGIAPTLVALIAIWINNIMADKREREKNEKAIKVESLVNLQNDAIEVNNMIFDTGRAFLDYMQFLNNEEVENWKIYYKKLTDTIMSARKLMILSEMEYEKTKIKNVLFDKCFKLISNFHKDLENIIKNYYGKAKCSSEYERNKVLDQVQVELIIESTKIENQIINYIKVLSKEVVEINTKKKRNKLLLKIFYTFKWWINLLVSIILILSKILVLPAIIFDLLLLILSKIFMKFKYTTISDCFVLNNKKNRIEQLINLKMYKDIWKYDFYEDKNLLIKKLQEVDLKERLKNNKLLFHKELSCTTNKTIYFYVLKKYIGKKNLRIDSTKNILIFQPIEKLTYMSPIVVWKHLIIKKGRRKYIRDLYRYEEIKTYYFNISRV